MIYKINSTVGLLGYAGSIRSMNIVLNEIIKNDMEEGRHIPGKAKYIIEPFMDDKIDPCEYVAKGETKHE